MRRRGVLLGLAVVLLQALVLPAPGHAPPAHAAAVPARALPAQATEDEPGVRVLLDALTPVVPRPGADLVVSGRVQNLTDETVRDGVVRLRLSRTPVLSRDELAALADGELRRTGSPLPVRALLPAVSPGASARFTLTVPLDDLRLDGFGVYRLGVEALGSVSAGHLPLATTWTFLPWAPDPLQVLPTQVAWLWPLATVPQRLASGRFLDDALADELAPQGRLSRLVDAAEGQTVTWLVDPMLLDDADDMTDGYALAGDGAPGAGDEAAQAFLGRLRDATAGEDPVVALPYADADVTSLARHGHAELAGRARRTGATVARRVLGREARGDVVVPPAGFADDTAAVLEDARAVVLDARALPADAPYTVTGRAELPLPDGGVVDALLTDPVLSRLAAQDTAAAGSAVLARQRFLAETAMVTAERPGVQRLVAVAPPTRWAPAGAWAETLLDATAQAPWLQVVDLDDALATPAPDVARARLGQPEDEPGDELPAGYLDSVTSVDERARVVAEVLVEGQGLLSAFRVHQLRLASAALRDRPDLRATLLEDTERALEEPLSRIRVLPTEVMRPVEQGVFPLTVENGLDQPVRVRVTFRGGSPALSLADSDVVEVGARRRATVNVQADPETNGVVTVLAQLTTASGVPIGDATPIRVRISEYGPVTVVITVAAALLLFATATFRVVRRIGGARGGGDDRGRGTSHGPSHRDDPAPDPARYPAPAGAARPRGRHVG